MRILRWCLLLGVLIGCNGLLGVDDASPRPPSKGEPASGCTSNAECLAETGEYDPSACIDGSCVRLLTPECPLLLPQTDGLWLNGLRSTDPEPVIFGIFSQVTPNSLFGVYSHNYDLAFTELMRTEAGLPAAGGKRRPVVALVCQNKYDTQEGLDTATEHLIEELKVPGIIAGLEAHDIAHAFQRDGYPHHVFFLSPYGAETLLNELDDEDLVWTMLPGGKELAPTYAPLLDLTLEHLRKSGQLAEGASARVAVVRADNVVVLSDMATALTSSIRFNGKSAQANSPDNFRAFSIATSDAGLAPQDYSTAIQGLIDFAPHVIISAAGSEFLTSFIPNLEAAALPQKPTYLLSIWNAHELASYLVDSDYELRTRLLGVNYAAAPDQTIYDAYQARFDAAYPALAGTTGKENFYDAAYYLLYSAAAAGPGSLIGADLAQGMRRLLSGRPELQVGPDDLPTAYQALQQPGSSITLDGAMGPPNFDLKTGARSGPASVWCIDSDGSYRSDVLTLSSDGSLAGTFPCFSLP